MPPRDSPARRLGYRVAWQLGKLWSRADVAVLIERVRAEADANVRVIRVAEAFLERRTPFRAESKLRPLPDHTLRARFWSHDCITFIYTVHALANARSLDEFAENLRKIRYQGAPTAANLIHYAWNSTVRMMQCGFVHDITAALLDESELAQRSVRLGIKADGSYFLGPDFGARGDHNCGTLLTVRYVPTERFPRVQDRLRAGDTLLFVSAADPGEYPGIVRHALFVYALPGDERRYVLHCGMARVGHHRGRRSGVSILSEWDPQKRLLIDGPPRPLQKYLEQHPEWWKGFVVLRGGAPPT